MNAILAATVKTPDIDWGALGPLIALTVGACVVLMTGLLRSPAARTNLVPALATLTLIVAGALAIGQWDSNADVLEEALRMDNLALAMTVLFCFAGVLTVALSLRDLAPRDAGHGEYYALLLVAVMGMVVLASAQNLVTVFLGFEVLSIPLYVLCATHLSSEGSLESGLKYLIIGSVGSACLLYGLALLYGATGATDFDAIAQAVGGGEIRGDVLFLSALALILTGLAFKASVAPFHQWTPDVYEGAPTPVTAFMAVATKAAALAIIVRLFDVAVVGAVDDWAPAMEALAVITMLVGNVGAIGQSSVKRMLAYSSVAQAGYMLVGVIVSTRLGVQALTFYLVAYVLMNMAAFAVIVARERETGLGDDISALRGLGAERPTLAWPITIAMLALAGFPATMGFWGKIYLIDAAVDNGWAWLGVAIVLGSSLSLVYYLRVVAAVWMPSLESSVAVAARPAGARPIMAGASPEADDVADTRAGAVPAGGDTPTASTARGTHEERTDADIGDGRDPSGRDRAADRDHVGRDHRHVHQPEVVLVAVACAAAVLLLGVFPDPLFDVARDVGEAFGNFD